MAFPDGNNLFAGDFRANLDEKNYSTKETEVVRQLTKLANFMAAPMKKHI